MKANTAGKKPAQPKTRTETIALGKLVNASAAIESHAAERVSIKLSLKMFRLRKAAEHSIEFYREKMREILAQYGQKTERGEQKYDEKGNALIDSTKIEDCRTAIRELEHCEVEKPSICFEVDELEEIKLSMNDIAVLEDFIAKE